MEQIFAEFRPLRHHEVAVAGPSEGVDRVTPRAAGTHSVTPPLWSIEAVPREGPRWWEPEGDTSEEEHDAPGAPVLGVDLVAPGRVQVHELARVLLLAVVAALVLLLDRPQVEHLLVVHARVLARDEHEDVLNIAPNEWDRKYRN